MLLKRAPDIRPARFAMKRRNQGHSSSSRDETPGVDMSHGRLRRTNYALARTERQHELEVQVNHHDRKILHAFFAHPISTNIEFKDAEHALAALGAEIDMKSGNRVEVTLRGQKTMLHRNHHNLSRDDVSQVRKFLEGCGVTAEAFSI